MATSALKAWGTVVAFDGVTIGEITSFNGSRTRNLIDVFSCSSTDEAVERLTSGLDEGAWSFACIYQPGNAQNYDVLNDKFLQGKKGTLTVTGPVPTGATAPVLSVTGIITALSVPQFGSAHDIKTVDFTITASGKVTYKDSSGVTTSASVSTSPSSSAS